MWRLTSLLGLWLASAVLSDAVHGQAPPAAARSDKGDATTVLAAARKALGGDAKIAAVKTLVLTGRTRQVRGNNLVPIEFEIQIELPDKYSRRDETPAQDTGPNISGFNGDRLVQLPKPPMPLPEPAATARVTSLKQDFARLMLGFFASTYSSYPLTFTHIAQAEAPQGTADVLEAKGFGDFTSRLFIATQTHLPVLASWETKAPTGASEHRFYFADYREVDGLQLPFRFRRALGSETTEETTVDRYRINARIDPRRFEP